MKKKLFDVVIDDIEMKKVVDIIFSGINENLVIVTPNVDHVNRIHKDENFKEIYKNSDVIINDSKILKFLSYPLNINLKHVNPGSDVTETLFSDERIQKCNICVVGAKAGDIAFLNKRYNLNIRNHIEPSYGFINDENEVNEIIEKARLLPASLFFLAVGSPRQEILATKFKQSGVKGAFFCCGASLLFLTGEEKRAPLGFQKLGLEWFFRLIQSPRRLLKRYIIDGPYIFYLFYKYKFKND